MSRGRGSVLLIAVAAAAVAVAGCGTSAAGPAHGALSCSAAPFQHRLASGDLERPALAQPARSDVARGVFVHPLRLDGDSLLVTPPRSSDHAGFSGDRALCEVLASTLSNGSDVGRQASDSLAAGLARVTVADGLLHQSRLGDVVMRESIDGIPDVPAKTPQPTPYHDRLAWVVVVRDGERASCGNLGASPRPRHTAPGLHGYAVFIVDAATGGNALLYTEHMNSICPGGNPQGPWVDVPLTHASVPFQLVSIEQDRSSGLVRFRVGPCDGYPRVVLTGANGSAPNVVRVPITRPFGNSCDPQRSITEKLRADIAGKPLPGKLVHAPVGPYIL